ncbi:hypothetical protein BJ741DRAFT_589251 [Chytriomyces cf. hyalinus JEL632]|nr:hypothetical protein BJ741DRAFT_589251 [Chytriomyces cf. hyalinus JEL632]
MNAVQEFETLLNSSINCDFSAEMSEIIRRASAASAPTSVPTRSYAKYRSDDDAAKLAAVYSDAESRTDLDKLERKLENMQKQIDLLAVASNQTTAEFPLAENSNAPLDEVWAELHTLRDLISSSSTALTPHIKSYIKKEVKKQGDTIISTVVKPEIQSRFDALDELFLQRINEIQAPKLPSKPKTPSKRDSLTKTTTYTGQSISSKQSSHSLNLRNVDPSTPMSRPQLTSTQKHVRITASAPPKLKSDPSKLYSLRQRGGKFTEAQPENSPTHDFLNDMSSIYDLELDSEIQTEQPSQISATFSAEQELEHLMQHLRADLSNRLNKSKNHDTPQHRNQSQPQNSINNHKSNNSDAHVPQWLNRNGSKTDTMGGVGVGSTAHLGATGQKAGKPKSSYSRPTFSSRLKSKSAVWK